MEEAQQYLKTCNDEAKDFYEAIQIVMSGVCTFMMRYHDLLLEEQAASAESDLPMAFADLYPTLLSLMGMEAQIPASVQTHNWDHCC